MVFVCVAYCGCEIGLVFVRLFWFGLCVVLLIVILSFDGFWCLVFLVVIGNLVL